MLADTWRAMAVGPRLAGGMPVPGEARVPLWVWASLAWREASWHRHQSISVQGCLRGQTVLCRCEAGLEAGRQVQVCMVGRLSPSVLGGWKLARAWLPG